MSINAQDKTTETTAKNIPLHYAGLYLADGYCPIPVRPRDKAPVDKEWQNLRLTKEELPARFPPMNNVSVLLGEASSGLIDIDLDNDNALKLAPYFLPDTNFRFGRFSKPNSHWVYQAPNSGSIARLKTKETVIEVRANGGHTVFPGSVHKDTGELIEFNGPIGEELPIPATTTREILDAAAKIIAIGSVLMDSWTKGRRHDLTLAIGGLLAKNGWAEDDVVRLVGTVAELANDEELPARINCIRTTFENYNNGQPTKGWAGLTETIGDEQAGYIRKFVGGNSLSGDHVTGAAANSNCQWTSAQFATDHDAAVTFSIQCEGNFRYSTASSQWYRREVQVFEPVADVIVQGAVGDFAAMAHHKLKKAAAGLKSRSKINAIMELSRSQLVVNEKTIDNDRNLVGLADGRILDLTTGNLVLPAQNLFVTKKLGANYDPAAQCPQWDRFLSVIFNGNQFVIDFVQRAVGYSLSGEVSEQCLFIMIGTGANGKSTFINALRKVFGDYSGTTPMQTLTVMAFSNGQTNDLAAMEGKRFISASDGEAGQRLAEAKIKNMTGGDKISCRALYKDFREYDPQLKLWVATNDLPNVTGSDDAIWRRIRVITFPVTIPEDQRDQNLSTNLANEASGILNWALAGYREWKTRGGLKPPAEVTDATGKYRRENDLVGQFIDERCCNDSAAKCSSKALHAGYVRWCDDNGHAPLPLSTFGKEIQRKGFSPRRSNKGNGWGGLDLQPAFQPTDHNASGKVDFK